MLAASTIILLLVSVVLTAAHESHAHKDTEPCAAHTRSHEAMEHDATYKQQHEEARVNARKYVQQQRKRGDHQFLKILNKEDFSNLSEEQAHRERRRQRRRRRRMYAEYEANIDSEPVVTIPIVWHILYSNSDENLSEQQLESQILVLNEDFRANNDVINQGQVDSNWQNRVGDAKIEFYTHQINRVAITDAFNFCKEDDNIKVSANGGSDQWDPRTYLNIWTCDLSAEDLLGYALFPCLFGTTLEYRDGVVLNNGVVGSSEHDDGSFYLTSSGSYDRGRTASHEVGHYLLLQHVWGTAYSCNTDDTDDIDDTPMQYGPNRGCPTFPPDSCYEIDSEAGTDLPDMSENFMDYVNDACMYMFTEEQVWTMRSILKGCRIDMFNNGVSANQTMNRTFFDTSDGAGNYFCEGDDSCILPTDYVNDGYCDCQLCDDEQFWTCSNCTCPDTCGDYTRCDGSGDGGDGTGTDTGPIDTNPNDDWLPCGDPDHDACQYKINWGDNGFCDCPNCADESDYTCETCSSTLECPGDECFISPTECDFECDDGTRISPEKVDDSACDCSNCEDEIDFTCCTCSANGTCTNAPVTCDGTGRTEAECEELMNPSEDTEDDASVEATDAPGDGVGVSTTQAGAGGTSKSLNDGAGLSDGDVAWVVVVCVISFIVLVVAGYTLWRRKKKKQALSEMTKAETAVTRSVSVSTAQTPGTNANEGENSTKTGAKNGTGS